MSAPESSQKETSEPQSFAVGDIVLAKVKGYPPWPGVVLGHDEAPAAVQRLKPPKSKGVFLVRFFPTAEHSWSFARDISPLTPKEIQAYLDDPSKKKKGDLMEGFRIAQNPTSWMQRYSELVQAYNEADTEDQLASEGDGAAPGGGKKRKRKSEGGKKDADDKKGKKAKIEKLAKSRTAGGKKQEDDGVTKPASAPTEEDPGLKQVKEWRHKLQRVFLGKDGVQDSEVPKTIEHFDAMEKFEMRTELLMESKLGKVLKRIAIIEPGVIPGDDEHKFRQRAGALVRAWGQLSGASGAGEGTPSASAQPEEAPASAPTTAEEKKDEEAKPIATEDKESAPPAPVDEEKKADEAPAPAPATEEPKVAAPAEPGSTANAMDVDAPAPTTNGNGTAPEPATAPESAPTAPPAESTKSDDANKGWAPPAPASADAESSSKDGEPSSAAPSEPKPTETVDAPKPTEESAPIESSS